VAKSSSRRYEVPAHGLRTIAALSILRDQVLGPLLAAARTPVPAPKLITRSTIDDHYQALRTDMEALFSHLHLVAA